jgi:hypothetical protein
MVVVAAISWPRPAGDKHFLAFSEDSFKTAFASGNLTVAVTHDWPRVIFEHATDPFASTFEVGLPRLCLFDDSNSDGMFSLSELKFVSYLDNDHVTWNITPVSFGHDAAEGEFAAFEMTASLSLYNGTSNDTLAVSDWATVALRYMISQANFTLSNSLGSYQVVGLTDIAVDLSLDIRKPMAVTGVVVEQTLVGGGTTNMFVLKQDGAGGSVVDEFASESVDERVNGTNFTNRFTSTVLPYQEIAFAKGDHTVRAYYKWDSEPTIDDGGLVVAVPMASSYFTTGSSMILHTAYLVGNGTGTIHELAVIGIDEAGFAGVIHDWLRENLVAVTAFAAAMVAVVALSGILLIHYRSRGPREPATPDEEDKKKP